MKYYMQRINHIIHREEKDGFHILFDIKKNNLLILNSSANLIWDQCKKKASAKDVETFIKENFDKIIPENLAGVINETLDKLTQAGFLKIIS